MSKWKRLAALGCTAMLVIGTLGACGNASNIDNAAAQTDESNTAQSGASGEGASVDWTEPYDEMVSVNIARVSSTNWPDGESVTNNKFMNWIRDNMNIDVKGDYIFADQDTLNQQTALWMTSGELPDIIMVDDEKLLTQLLESGLIADLTDEYELYASDLFKDMLASYDGAGDVMERVTVDGRIMAVTSMLSGYSYDFPWIRADWLEELNLDEPETMDELLEVAKRFVEEDMAGNGKTIGIELIDLYDFQGKPGMGTMLFNMNGSYPGRWCDDGNGNYTYGSIAPETKEVLRQLNELYNEGVLAKDLASRDTDASIAEGNCGIFFGPWWVPGWPLNTTLNNDPEAVWKPLKILDENGQYCTFSNNCSKGWAVVRKDYEHPEVAIKLMNLMLEVGTTNVSDGMSVTKEEMEKYNFIIPDDVKYYYLENGISGIGWSDWPYTISFGFYDTMIRIGEYMNTRLTEYQAGNTGDMLDVEIDKMRHITDYESGADTSPEAQIEYDKYEAVKLLMDLEDKLNFQKVYYPFSTDTMDTNWASLKDKEEKAFMQIIMGEQPVDYFDTFVAEWKAQGGDLITQEVNEAANK